MKKTFIFLATLTSLVSSNKKYCDIKGSVNNPGVYEIKENYTINDVIKDAGGLKRNSFTDNINLSKKVTDEMVIYVFSKNEINKINEIKNCKCEDIYVYKDCQNDPNNIVNNEINPDDKNKVNIEITTQKNISELEITTEKINKSKININICTKEDLMTINGLGEAKANAIIEYRLEHGNFFDIKDLLNVKGIKEALYEKIKDYIEI